MPTVQRKKPQQYTKVTDDFYFSSPWRSLRRITLTEEPLCYYCQMKGIITAATIADHFKPRRIFPELQLVRVNIKPSCDPCHNIKRVFERGIATREQFEKEIGTFIQSIKVRYERPI
jgi:5-methylcytosine-specific restriction endonuclease McrA